MGLTFCPGKRGEAVFGEDWDRDLSTDLGVIREWGATAVVTLMEWHELQMLGVGALGEAVEGMGMHWMHLPISDLGAPDRNFERRWVYFGADLRRRLRRGEKVLIHCRGGRGRTGLLAGRLLVEAGMEPAHAIAATRRARTGTIENDRQERHVLSCRIAAQDNRRTDRVLGCLMGGALGDALGYEVEFDSLRAIRRRFGPQGITEPVPHGGRLIVSDDTQMTLFTAIALAAAIGEAEGETIEEIRRFYIAWYRTQRESFDPDGSGSVLRYPELWARRAPGNTCMGALAVGGNGSPERPINNSKGCGGVMRAAPVGLVAGMAGDQAFRLGARAAALTHGHPSGFLSAAALASIIADLLGGDPLEETIGKARRRLAEWSEHEETIAAIDLAVSLARENRSDHDEALRLLGGGWVGEEALAIALYAVLVSSSFPEAIGVAANHDGDSDSTASIAGQIWGASHGLDALPSSWVAKIDVLDPLCEAAGMLLAVRPEAAPADERG
jgi:ADP-ribosylglycohydrolase/protein-tyrosine phosphatase